MPEHGPFCPIFYFREPHFAHFLRKFVRIFSTCRPIPFLSMLIHSCFKLDYEKFNFSNLLTLCKFMPKCTALSPMVLHDPQGIGFPGVLYTGTCKLVIKNQNKIFVNSYQVIMFLLYFYIVLYAWRPYWKLSYRFP